MSEPIFKTIIGDSWDDIPLIMKMHYANKAYSDDISVTKGIMTVEASLLWKLISPFSKMFGILVPYTGEEIPVTVTFRSSPGNNHFVFDRVFNFPNKEPYQFYSTLYPIEGREVIEVMKTGIGWRCEFKWTQGKVLLLHKGYVFKIFGRFIPLPISFLIGKGYAEEVPIDDNTFSMKMEIMHPWWGKILGYSGIFTMPCKGDE